jgi:hypothetical protein
MVMVKASIESGGFREALSGKDLVPRPEPARTRKLVHNASAQVE